MSEISKVDKQYCRHSTKRLPHSNQESTSSFVRILACVTNLVSPNGTSAPFPGRENTRMRQFSV